MKKTLAMILALTMVMCCFAGCGNGDTGSSPDPAPTDSASPAPAETPSAEPSEAPSPDPAVSVPASAAPVGDGIVIPTGEYIYMETAPFGELPWYLVLNDDGTAVISQPENEYMGCPTWDAKWTDNGDGTVLTYDCEGDGSRIANFWEDTSILWQILNDGNAVPVRSADYPSAVETYGIFGGASSGDASDGVKSGEYSYVEDTPFGEISWVITLNDDGSYTMSQPDNTQLGSPSWTGNWVDNGDGTVTCADAQGDGPQIADFWVDGGITWTINSDGTATPVQ